MDARELARAVRGLATRSDEEQNKPAIVRYADELTDMRIALQEAYTNANAASRWYDANDLATDVTALAAGDPVPGTPYTKAELMALHALRGTFDAYALTETGTIYHVPDSLTTPAVVEPPV